MILWCKPQVHANMKPQAVRTHAHTQAGLYLGVRRRGEPCEGLGGLDAVDFAVNLQSLCAQLPSSLAGGGPPIRAEEDRR